MFTQISNAVANTTTAPITLSPEFSAEFAAGSTASNSGTINFGQRVNDNNSPIGGQALQLFVTIVPEPSSAALAALGSLLIFRRKRC